MKVELTIDEIITIRKALFTSDERGSGSLYALFSNLGYLRDRADDGPEVEILRSKK